MIEILLLILVLELEVKKFGGPDKDYGDTDELGCSGSKRY